MKSRFICGLDEVGRGALAGPLVAAAVIYPSPNTQEFEHKLSTIANAPIRDSKKLTSLQRQRLYQSLTKTSAQIFIASISVREINANSIGWANRQVFQILIQQILHRTLQTQKHPAGQNCVYPLHFIVDGNLKLSLTDNSSPRRITSGSAGPINQVKHTVSCIPKADATYPIVSLASIVAKESRDQLMHHLHQTHPHYDWDTNVGYGTGTHIQALHLHGPSPHHRTQFVNTALNQLKTHNE